MSPVQNSSRFLCEGLEIDDQILKLLWKEPIIRQPWRTAKLGGLNTNRYKKTCYKVIKAGIRARV